MGLFRWEERKMQGRERGIDKKKEGKNGRVDVFLLSSH